MLEGIASSSNHTAVPVERIAERIKCGHVQASTFAVETLQSLTLPFAGLEREDGDRCVKKLLQNFSYLSSATMASYYGTCLEEKLPRNAPHEPAIGVLSSPRKRQYRRR